MSPIFKSVFNALMGIDNDLIHEQFLERDYTKLELLLKEKSITLTRLAQCINFYPGTKSSGCHEYAFFVSLQDQPKNSRLKLREYVKFDELLQQVVRHCQGSCSHNTWRIGILADNLDNASLKFWKYNFKEIQRRGVEIEFYLLVAGNPVEISLSDIV